MVELSFRNPHLPLCYLILNGSQAILLRTEAGLRAFSVLCSTATLLIIVTYAWRRWSSSAAAYAGLFIAPSSFDICYAQEARMYTLLRLRWISSYLLSVHALKGRSHLSVPWGVACAAMAWTHFYGLLVIATELALLAVREIWRRLSGHAPSLVNLRSIGGILVAVVGSPPSAVLLWNYRSGGAGGSWIPQLQDPLSLLALVGAGLAGAREHFLDSAHLVLPMFQQAPGWIWVLVGGLLCGGFALAAMVREWLAVERSSQAAPLGMLLFGVPILAASVYARLFHTRAWALKPLLGAAYLLYLWAGVGVSMLRSRWARRGVAVAAVCVSLISLVPYFTTWAKTDADTAFRSVPATKGQGAVLLDRAY